MALGFDDLAQILRARTQHHADEDKAGRDFVGYHLRRRTQRAEKGVTGIGRPAGENDPIDAERADREEIEDPDIDIGDYHSSTERDDRPGDEGEGKGDQR